MLRHAVSLLANRPHSTHELTAKLARMTDPPRAFAGLHYRGNGHVAMDCHLLANQG